MNNLFVNGCSFTAGSEVTHTINGIVCEFKDEGWLWPNRLQKLLGANTLTNLAIGGNSNDKIVRTTIEYLSKANQPKPDLAIIQFTAPVRSEYFVETYKAFANYCNTENLIETKWKSREIVDPTESIFGYHFDSLLIEDKIDQESGVMENHRKAVEHAVKFLWSHEDIIIKFLKNIILLQSFLEQKQIPYLFTSMSESNNPLMLKDMVDIGENVIPFITQLLDVIRTQNFTRLSLSAVAGNNRFSDLHPNAVGNEKISKFLYDELQMRKYI